jgi:hypothetical protein
MTAILSLGGGLAKRECGARQAAPNLRLARYMRMTSALTLARLAAVVAIFGFFLPWAEVSCSGQALTHASGIQLITGDVGGAAVPAHHDLWVAAALALIVLGLAGGLFAGRRAALILMAAALAAAIASLIGVSQEVPNAEAQAQIAGGPYGGDASARQAAGELIRAKLEYGYFVTLGGLIVAIAGGGLALAGRRSPGGGQA